MRQAHRQREDRLISIISGIGELIIFIALVLVLVGWLYKLS